MKFTEISPYSFPSGDEIGFLSNMSTYDEKSDFVKLHEETILENEISFDAEVVNFDPIVIDNLSTGYKSLIIWGEFIKGDLREFKDINKLLKSIDQLIDRGNSVIIIEHNLEIIKASDYIIDLGPYGGNKGGEIVYQGDIDEFLKSETLTAINLKKVIMYNLTLEQLLNFTWLLPM